jgi:hypothetical protein
MKKKIVFLLYHNLLVKKKMKLYILLCYNLFNLLIIESIKRLSFINYILILKNLDYGRNNKYYIIIIYFFRWGGINYMPKNAKFLNTGLCTSETHF